MIGCLLKIVLRSQLNAACAVCRQLHNFKFRHIATAGAGGEAGPGPHWSAVAAARLGLAGWHRTIFPYYSAGECVLSIILENCATERRLALQMQTINPLNL